MQSIFFDGHASWFPYERHIDNRGKLAPFNYDDLPFTPNRTFIVSDVPAGEIRGQHALSSETQLFVCLQGSIEVMMRYQNEEIILMLNPSSSALILNHGIWSQQTYVEENSILLVFASEPYNPESYIA
jgi:dTDP-4-dehydrorhamnose 3,5-epimerase-like enzyme